MFLVVACTPSNPPASPAAGPSGPGVVAGSGPSVGGVEAPATTPGIAPVAAPATTTAVVSGQSLRDLPGFAVEARVGEAVVSLLAAGDLAVDPSATFEVRGSVPLRGTRLVLLDSRDAAVEGLSEVTLQPGTRITLVPLETLTPGSRYLLRLESSTGRVLRGPNGSTYEPFEVALKVTGDPPPPPPKKKSKKKRH